MGVPFVYFVGSLGVLDPLVCYVRVLSFVWYSIFMWLGWDVVMPRDLLGHYYVFLGLGADRRVRCGLTLVWHIVWSIWLSRNDFIFSGHSTSVEQLVYKIKLYS
jgi:hypothetical protein